MGVSLVLSVGTAVDAGKGTGPGNFPGDSKGRQSKVRAAHMMIMQAAFGGGIFGQVRVHRFS